MSIEIQDPEEKIDYHTPAEPLEPCACCGTLPASSEQDEERREGAPPYYWCPSPSCRDLAVRRSKRRWNNAQKAISAVVQKRIEDAVAEATAEPVRERLELLALLTRTVKAEVQVSLSARALCFVTSEGLAPWEISEEEQRDFFAAVPVEARSWKLYDIGRRLRRMRADG